MKKKNLLLTFLLVALICGGGVNEAWAATEIDGIYYSFSGSGSSAYATVVYNTTTAPGSYSGVVIIPESVTYNNTTYPVTEIGYNAFANSTGLTSVTIPASITKFGSSAFLGCTALAEIIYNATSCTDMFSGPFSASTAENITISIGNNVTKLPNYIFAGLTHLTTISIPASVESIGNYAFQGCTGLITVPMGTGVTTIGNYAYKGCTGITTITIPSNVTSIGTNAFENCTGLTEINYNVTTHADFTTSTKPFKGCSTYYSSNITLNIGFNVEKIPAYVFNGVKVAGDVVIPGSVSTIGTYAFTNNGGLYTSITTVYMLSATPPALANSDIFKTGSSTCCNIKVLYSSEESILDAYKGAAYWSTYSNTISETDKFTVTNMDLTGITSPVTIPAGNTITVTGTATNPTAVNLVIEDGAQLVCNNNPTVTMVKHIDAADWGDNTSGWNFIATPITAVTINNTAHTNLIGTPTGVEYDLYRFNQSAISNQWQNYKQNHFTTLENGTGYLYARNADIDVLFMGELAIPSGEINLAYDETAEPDMKGWNLVGNPFPCNATVDQSFYVVDGRTIKASTAAAVAPCSGVMVRATAATRKVKFTKAPEASVMASAKNNINMTLTNANERSTETLDNAIICFDEGSELGKFYFGEQEANIYIPQGLEEYAIVSAEAQGEMPVNFKANQNGQYTISVNVEDVEMNYLHLIDNMTGADIDLKAAPSYTFNATVNDYASRFRLVFSANGIEETVSDDQPFAFISNGQIFISNEGEATLQMIDITGRMVSNEAISGSCSKNVNVANGIYMLRLVNGENVKTQKIVVR